VVKDLTYYKENKDALLVSSKESGVAVNAENTNYTRVGYKVVATLL
jgi:hypothetical protein